MREITKQREEGSISIAQQSDIN